MFSERRPFFNKRKQGTGFYANFTRKNNSLFLAGVTPQHNQNLYLIKILRKIVLVITFNIFKNKIQLTQIINVWK